MTIKRFRSGLGYEWVEGVATSAEHFAITNSVNHNGKRYSLTHGPSGYAVAHSNKHKPLRLFAAILVALPIPWGKIRTPKSLSKHWRKLPIEIQRWRKDFMESM